MRQVAAQSDVIAVAGKDAVPQYAKVAIGSSGNNTIVSAVASRKLRVVSGFFVAAGDVVAYFLDGAGTAIAGDGTNGIDLTANSGFTLPFNPVGWFETASGQSLDINLDGNVSLAGSLTYIEVEA